MDRLELLHFIQGSDQPIAALRHAAAERVGADDVHSQICSRLPKAGLALAGRLPLAGLSHMHWHLHKPAHAIRIMPMSLTRQQAQACRGCSC